MTYEQIGPTDFSIKMLKTLAEKHNREDYEKFSYLINFWEDGFPNSEMSKLIFDKVTELYFKKAKEIWQSHGLGLLKEYEREDVHAIFSPHTKFTKGSGIWGAWGIVPLTTEDINKEFVLFISIGAEQSGYVFDEKVSEDGILDWQSQPKNQSLDHKDIKKIIEKNDNIIHLFYRREKRVPYHYLGKLKYFSHDPSIHQPAHIKFKLLDWDKIQDILKI